VKDISKVKIRKIVGIIIIFICLTLTIYDIILYFIPKNNNIIKQNEIIAPENQEEILDEEDYEEDIEDGEDFKIEISDFTARGYDVGTPENITKESAFKLFNMFLSEYTHDNMGFLGIVLKENGQSEIKLNDLSESDRFNILIRSLLTKDFIPIDKYTLFIKKQAFDNNSLKFFGKLTNLEEYLFYFPLDCQLQDDGYKCIGGICGGEATGGLIHFPTDYTIQNNKLIINGYSVYDGVDAYFPNSIDDDIGYCGRWQYNSQKNDKECLDKYQDHFDKISITFDISKGNFLFESIKRM